MVKNINKLLLINSESAGKKLFFLNPIGSMEKIWLLLPKNSDWKKLSPKVPADLNSRGYLNYYSQIDNHVVMLEATRDLEPNNGNDDIRRNNSLRPR